MARRVNVAPLELESAWVRDGSLRVVPVGDGELPDAVDVRLETRGAEFARLRLQRDAEGNHAAELDRGVLLRVEGAPFHACRLGDGDRVGPPVWVQNLDAIESRSNPVQRPRHGRGLQGLGRDSLGLDEGAWNSLFDAFMALSRGWGEYAKTFKPESGFAPFPRTVCL